MTTRHTPANTSRTPACHHDRRLGHRVVTGHHTDDCPTHQNRPQDCPGAEHRGCQPCTADHCVLCRIVHADDEHPVTCPTCINRIRNVLHDVLWHCRHLRWQATRGEGLALPSARIPGGDALVLYARAGAFLENLKVAHGYTIDEINEDHRPDDVVPVILPLASWAIAWRRYFGHELGAAASVSGIVHYLADGKRLQLMAQCKDGPDWAAFAWDMSALLRQLEGVLHDESEPERGVSCFECGQRLVRRYGKPKPCGHTTPGRQHLAQVRRGIRAAQQRVAAIRTYPELGEPTYADLRAARATPTSAEEAGARVPCDDCVHTGQGGIDDPSIGQSWECSGCAKKYTPGEYANAVRADLQKAGPDGDGWTFISMAAEAASTQTGHTIGSTTVRKWADRLQVGTCCRWAKGIRGGLVLVYWPDVADRAAELVERHLRLEVARQEREVMARRFYAALDAKGIRTSTANGTRAAVKLGKDMGIHPNRVRAFLDELEATREETA